MLYSPCLELDNIQHLELLNEELFRYNGTIIPIPQHYFLFSDFITRGSVFIFIFILLYIFVYKYITVQVLTVVESTVARLQT